MADAYEADARAQAAVGNDHAPTKADAVSARRAVLALESPSTLEWRRLFSELLGTFLLVMAGAGGAVVNAVSQGQISRTAGVTAPGLTVLAIILFMGGVSGAHLNPVVTVAFGLRGDFPWRRALGYILAQLVGATLACLFLLAVFGNVLGTSAPPCPDPGSRTGRRC